MPRYHEEKYAPDQIRDLRDENERLRSALLRLRGCIDDYGGHGNPGCPDRVEAYLAMAEVDALLTPNVPHNRQADGGTPLGCPS